MSYPGIGAIVAVLVFGAAIAQDAVVPAGAGRGPAGVAPREADPATRLRAVAALTRRGGAEAVRELIDVALFDGEARIRRAAVHGLGEIGAPECVGGLEQVFLDPERGVRRAAVEALLEIGGDQAALALLFALNDADRSLREDAVAALGDIGGPVAVTVLQHGLQDADRSVRETAAEVLEELVGAGK